MSTISSGLNNTKIIRSGIYNKACRYCNGSGELDSGMIEIHKKGNMMFIQDCKECNGKGSTPISVPVRRRISSKVEIV